MNRFREFQVFSAGCLLLLSGVATLHAQPAAGTAAVHQQLQRTLPDPLPPKTTAQAPATFYESSNLYEYMDGGADIFQLYDVRSMLHQDFRAGDVELTADVFDMGSLENAFGMYSAERSPSYNFVDIGTEGYRNEGIVNFYQDRYYVKLAAFGDGADALLDVFARGISARIGTEKTVPEMVATLPPANRKPHTEQFIRKDPIGHPFLSPAYMAVYANGVKESTLLISVAANAADAQKRRAELEEHFRKDGKVQPAPEYGEGALLGSNSYEGEMAFRVVNRYLLLLLKPSAGSAAVLTEVAGRLR